MKFKLNNLDYSYNALEPHIDAATMEIHHTKHHAAYITNLNNALKDEASTEEELLAILDNISSYSVAIRNNAGGHYNHSLFWKLIKPSTSNAIHPELEKELIKNFGSVEQFKKAFEQAALSRFGSGWAWLIKKEDQSLEVVSTPNQDNPLMDTATTKGTPLLALDVWEHAYYLKYQNKRADYIQAFWHIINWQEVYSRWSK